jgi:hypothetical protein
MPLPPPAGTSPPPDLLPFFSNWQQDYTAQQLQRQVKLKPKHRLRSKIVVDTTVTYYVLITVF